MTDDRLRRQMEFCLEADKEKQIMRHTFKSNGIDRENDAEHAWHMAVMCLLLGEYANEPVDMLRTISMILIHDVVEIDAGDTFAYDEQANTTRQEREQRAADRLFGILPPDQGEKLRALWDEFEAGETAEARFARAMDNIQPAMLNFATDGKAWTESGVRLSQILKRNEITPKGSKKLWEHSLGTFILPNVEKGRIIDDK